MILSSHVVVYAMVAFLLSSKGNSEKTFTIPVTINPLIQRSVVLGSITKPFYDMDKEFYSKFTVIDAALNTEQHIKDIIQKSISVVLLTTASSHISGSLKLSDLRYTKDNKWSYKLNVQSILDASNGAISELSDTTIIYKIQESAMKVLERRYEFHVNAILDKLGLREMDFYAVDEKQWIDVVGIITNKVLKSRYEMLNLTFCYFAEMVNKTQEEITSFTLNEVDLYLYNTSKLMHKLPAYRNAVLSSLYQTFNITASQLASMSELDISVVNTMNLIDVIQLFTRSVLKEFRLTDSQIIQSDPTFQPEMLLSCKDKWEPFRTLVISKSFDNAAESMSIASQTLASLIEISSADLNKFTLNHMLLILEMVIGPLKKDKKVLETSILFDLVSLYGTHSISIRKDNAFAAIGAFTNLTKHQLTLLYDWTQLDYQFASMFSLDDLNEVCSFDSYRHNLFDLARINIGEVQQGFSCVSFNALREIWEKKSVLDLEKTFSPEGLSIDKPISTVVSLLTNAPSSINFRVFNITPEVQQLIQEITLHNISAVTVYSSSYLKTMSFQDIIVLVVDLNQNGLFDQSFKVVSPSVIASLTPSLILQFTNNISTISGSQVKKSAFFTGISQLETVSHLHLYSLYQNQKTTPTSSYYQFYLRNLSPSSLAHTTFTQVPRFSYTMKILREQSSVIKTISQVLSTREIRWIKSSSVSAAFTLSSNNFTMTLSSSYISRPGRKKPFPNEDFSNIKTDQTNVQITTSFLHIGKIMTLNDVVTPRSSYYIVKYQTGTKESPPSFQSSGTNSAVSHHLPRLQITTKAQKVASLTSSTVPLQTISISTRLTESSKRVVIFHSSTYSLLKHLRTPQYLASTSVSNTRQHHIQTSNSIMNSSTPISPPLRNSKRTASLQTSSQNSSLITPFLHADYSTTASRSFGNIQPAMKSTTLMKPYLTKTMTSLTSTPYSQTNTTSVTDWAYPLVNTSTTNSFATNSNIAASAGKTEMPMTASTTKNLPAVISLVMQTTSVKNLIQSSIRPSSPGVTTLTTTSKIKLEVLYSSSPRIDTTFSQTSSNFPYDSSAMVAVSEAYRRTTTTYLPSMAVSITPMSSVATFPSPTSTTMNETVSIQPSAVKRITPSSNVIQPGEYLSFCG